MISGMRSLLFYLLIVCVLSAVIPHASCADTPPASQALLRTALTGKFPPFSFYSENGELSGFDVDVAREIARRIDRRCEIITTEWDGILAGLLAGKYDAIVGSMAITPLRQKQVIFSTPYYHSGAQLFVHRDNPRQIYSIGDCSGARIAVILGETYQHFLENRYPDIEVVTLKANAQIFEMLSQKRIDGFVTDKLVGSWQIKRAGRDFVPVGGLLYEESIAIPVRKEMPALLQEINVALAAMQQDGALRNIHERYFGLKAQKVFSHGAGIRKSVIVGKLLSGFAITLAIALASILLGMTLAVPCGLVLSASSKKMRIPRIIIRSMVDFLRGTPVLIQLLFVWMGLGVSPMKAAILTLGINAMAYMAEVLRAGLMSVDPGQSRAARALGLGRIQRFRYVVWPQAFRIAIPPLMNSVIALVKDTALVAVISIPEVIREAQSIISVTFEPGKYYFIVAVMFFVVTFPLMKLSGMVEKKIKQRGFVHD